MKTNARLCTVLSLFLFVLVAQGSFHAEPALRYCTKHGLPIAFRNWNLASNVALFETSSDQEFSNDETVHFIQNGQQKDTRSANSQPIFS